MRLMRIEIAGQAAPQSEPVLRLKLREIGCGIVYLDSVDERGNTIVTVFSFKPEGEKAQVYQWSGLGAKTPIWQAEGGKATLKSA